jgi:hypothetical protein
MRIEGTSTDGGLNIARVNKEGQLKTRSISATETEHSVDEGDAFQVYTGVLNIANDSPTAVLYIENNDTSDIIVTSATIGSGASTGGANNTVLVESVANTAASDDIVQNGTDVPFINRNGGASRQFSGVCKKGPSLAATNGVPISGELGEYTKGQQISLTNIIPKGGNLALQITPPVGNTSIDFTVVVSFHVIEVI